MQTSMQHIRCFGNIDTKPLYAKYHDEEWGIPVFNDTLLFEMLTLEGAQAGLSFEIVLKKRHHYQRLFHQFNLEKILQMSTEEINLLCHNTDLIRHKLKIHSVQKNAHIYQKIQKEFGSFANYLWGYVNHTPIINHWQKHSEVPTKTPLSIAISKDLKKRGMSFIGPTIIYAYIQAIGIVNDHLTTCWKHNSNKGSHQQTYTVNTTTH